MAANPRKFSERIALHTQKQHEKTAAFEQIMREVKQAYNSEAKVATSCSNNATATPIDGGLLNIPDRSLGAFRSGSLPNVNQANDAAVGHQMMMSDQRNSKVDLQGALTNLANMKRQDVSPSRSRGHHRQRAATGSSHQRHHVSPYASSNYLSPPHESNWRRTNSDSAINQSPSREPFHQVGSPSHRRSTVNSCSQSEVMQQMGIDMYNFDAPPCRPGSAEVPSQEYGQALSPAHLTPPLGLGHQTSLSGSLPDLTNLHFSNTQHSAPSNHVSGVASLDGSPESNYSDYHDYQECQGSPVRSVQDSSNGGGSRQVNPSVSPPRITVECLTQDTIAMSLGNNFPVGVGSPYSEAAPSPLASSPSSPSLSSQCPQPTRGLQGPNTNVMNQLNNQVPPIPGHNQQHYDMMPNNVNATSMANSGNCCYRQTNGTANSIYDSYYNNLDDLNELDQMNTATPLQSFYDGSLQSPGSTGIPDIILTEPGALDEGSNNSTKVFSSSVGSGGQYFTPSPSPVGSPLPPSPDLQHSLNNSPSTPGFDSMYGFEADQSQNDPLELAGLHLLPDQLAAIMAAVSAEGFQS